MLTAVLQGRWPERVDAALREHAAQCEICSDIVAVVPAFEGAYEELVADAAVPDASRVWRLAQIRARCEAVEAAGRPITAAQVMALACAVGLLGACFGATSTWFQSAFNRVAASVGGFEMAALVASAIKVLVEHGPFVLGLAAAVLLVPTLFYVALGRD